MLLLMSNQEGLWQKITKNSDAMKSRLGEARIHVVSDAAEYHYHQHIADLMANTRVNAVWSQLNAERATAANPGS
jgi:hypothetical protein